MFPIDFDELEEDDDDSVASSELPKKIMASIHFTAACRFLYFMLNVIHSYRQGFYSCTHKAQ